MEAENKSQPVNSKSKMGKSNLGRNIIIALVALALLCCGLIVGFFGFIFAKGQEFENNKPLEVKAGVLSPDYSGLKADEYEKKEFGKLTAYSKDMDSFVAKRYIAIFDSEYVKPYLEKMPEEVKVYIDTDVARTHLDNDSYVLGDVFGDYVSGNYIYSQEGKDLSADPLSFHEFWLAAFIQAQVFNSFTESDLEKVVSEKSTYDLNKAPLTAEYKKTVGIADVSEYLQANKDVQTKLSGKKGVSLKDCENITNDITLLSCEARRYADTGLSLNPQTATFMQEKLGIRSNMVFGITNITAPNELESILDPLQMTKSALKFNSWDIQAIADPAEYKKAAESSYYHKVKDAKLGELKAAVEAKGWKLLQQSEKVKDNQFNADQYNIVFSKDSFFVKRQLIIQVMDTRSLKGDCIVQGLGKIYCDDESLYKNTDNYLHVIIAENVQEE